MSTDVFTLLSEEHETLLPLILDIQSAAEAADLPALVEKLSAGHQALTTELDAHMALEDDGVFVSVEAESRQCSTLLYVLRTGCA
jgi:hypothetical protein